MLQIEWLEGPSAGCIDILPDWVLPPSHATVLVHTGTTAMNKPYLAKCAVKMESNFIDFDYEKFCEFNERDELDIGIMRLMLEDGLVKDIQWLENGIDKDSKAKLIYLPQLDIAMPARRASRPTEKFAA